MTSAAFKLKVKQVGSICDFELSWGTGQTISVELTYLTALTTQYETWRRAYLDYYHRLRGRKGASGSLPKPAVDRHKELVSAEAQLLDDFQRWLLSPELVSIRREIARASRQAEAQGGWVEVFLTCTPLTLARLPWETWEIGTDLGTSERIRIARTPSNILYQPVRPLRRKARVLAILGDDTNLSSQENPEAFQGDREAVASLGRVTTVRFEGWRRGEEDMEAVKQRIVRAIADERGWDILFFAGHSNEIALLGGELGIAPGTTLALRELEEPLKQAKERGLQFAIFNSCSGIDIATSLISLGLSQVAVMREPIHNQVAREFLVPFLRSLAAYKDVGKALVDASQALRQAEKRLSYPSAYLVPSLFRHPKAELFCIQPFGIWSACQRWLPTPREVGWLAALLLLSLVPDVQSLVMEPRLLLQAAYRQVTQQLPPATAEPPVALVQIDEESLETDGVTLIEGKYLDYSYLARLLDRLSTSGTAVVGIDYILDRDRLQPENSLQLRQAVGAAVERGMWLVFGANERKGNGVSRRIADRDLRASLLPHHASQTRSSASYRTLAGDIFFFPWYVELLPADGDCTAVCPFSYLLALTYALHQEYPSPEALATSGHPEDLRTSFLAALPQEAEENDLAHFLHRLRLPALAQWFQWFHPIVDFSVPPDRAYERLPACEVLGTCGDGEPLTEAALPAIAIVAPGGYEEAGLKGRGGDNYTMPLAVAFWRDWTDEPFTGGEAHAYMLHHFLTRRLVVPIPDFWMLLLAAVAGKGITLVLLGHPRQRQQWLLGLVGVTVVYGLLGLQIYISAGVLIPWFLPSVLIWNNVRLAIRKQPYGTR